MTTTTIPLLYYYVIKFINVYSSSMNKYQNKWFGVLKKKKMNDVCDLVVVHSLLL